MHTTETRTYDQDYRLTGITVPAVESWSFSYNADDAWKSQTWDDDITGLTDNLNNAGELTPR